MYKLNRLYSLILLNSIFMLAPFYISAPMFILSGLALCYLASKEMKITNGFVNEWQIFFIYLLLIGLYLRNYLTIGFASALYLYYLFICIYQRHMTLTSYRRLLKVLSATSAWIAIDAIRRYLQYILSKGLPWHYILTDSNPYHRAESFFFNPNYYGLFCAMMVTVSFYLMKISKNWAHRSIYLVIAGLNSIALLLTGSRMAIPTVLVGVLFLFYFMFKALFVVTLLVGVGLLVLVMQRGGGIGRFSTLVYGFEDRFAIWDVATKIFLTRPLTGRGAFSYIQYYYLFSDVTKMHAHNFALDFLMNFGLFGALMLTNAITPFIRRCYQLIKDSKLSDEQILAFALICLAVVHSTMDVSLIWLQTGYFFLLFVSWPLSRYYKGSE